MKYIVNIKETNDVNNKIYYVFDSFGTVLGIFTNISLAYDLIISCFEDIENTYKEGPLNNVKKQIDEALRKKNNITSTDCENIKIIDEIIRSMRKTSGKMDQNQDDLIFYTTAIILDSEIRPIFDKNNIINVYWKLLKKVKNDKFNDDEIALAHLKKLSLETLSENEFSIYFSPLPKTLNNSEEKNIISKGNCNKI